MSNRLHDRVAEQRDARWAAFYASVDILLQQRPLRPTTMIESNEQPVVRSCRDLGMQSVPIYKIIVGTPRFAMFEHWVAPNAPRVYAATPIELYKVGNTYFIKDGNQRVATARRRGQVFLPAQVAEYVFDQPLDERTNLYTLLLQDEKRAFFKENTLPQLEANAVIDCSTLGNYQLLTRQIDLYRSQPADAGETWYAALYAPLISIIRRQNFNAYFPLHRETDVYLWATERVKPKLWHALPTMHANASPDVYRLPREVVDTLTELRQSLQHNGKVLSPQSTQ